MSIPGYYTLHNTQWNAQLIGRDRVIDTNLLSFDSVILYQRGVSRSGVTDVVSYYYSSSKIKRSVTFSVFLHSSDLNIIVQLLFWVSTLESPVHGLVQITFLLVQTKSLTSQSFGRLLFFHVSILSVNLESAATFSELVLSWITSTLFGLHESLSVILQRCRYSRPHGESR